MRITFVLSFYSSFKSSFKEGQWLKSGMPAVYKLFEKLIEDNIQFDVFFIERNNTTSKNHFNYFNKEIKGLHNTINLIKTSRSRWCPKLVYEFLIYKRIKKLSINICQDQQIIYCDRANITVGSFFKIINKTKVILRFHGITSWYYDSRKILWKVKNFDKFLSFKTDFDHVIFSEDGTPSKFFLEERMKTLNYSILLNGVDEDLKSNFKNEKINNNIKLLFLSRLDKSKGIEKLVKLCEKIHEDNLPIQIDIVGDGSYREDIEILIIKLNSDRINYYGKISHEKVNYFYKKSDIFLSFNSLGNLSNTVLEAIVNDCNIITFHPNNETKRDLSTFSLLNEALFFVDENNAVNESIDILKLIISNPLILEDKKQKLFNFKNTHIQSWKNRIQTEINIIKSI
jgi:glycosyltransferase involved in cell wall biosynthesis